MLNSLQDPELLAAMQNPEVMAAMQDGERVNGVAFPMSSVHYVVPCSMWARVSKHPGWCMIEYISVSSRSLTRSLQ